MWLVDWPFTKIQRWCTNLSMASLHQFIFGLSQAPQWLSQSCSAEWCNTEEPRAERRPSTCLQTTRARAMTSAVQHIAAAPCSWMRTPADPVTCFALNTVLQGRDGIWQSWQHRGLTQIFACPGNMHTLKSWPCCLTTGTISMVWNIFYCVKTQTSISGPLSLTFPTREMGLNDFYS